MCAPQARNPKIYHNLKNKAQLCTNNPNSAYIVRLRDRLKDKGCRVEGPQTKPGVTLLQKVDGG